MTTIDYTAGLDGDTTRTVRTSRTRLVAIIGAWFTRWRERRAERLMLLELSRWDPRLLRDIGIEPGEVVSALHGRHSRFRRRD